MAGEEMPNAIIAMGMVITLGNVHQHHEHHRCYGSLRGLSVLLISALGVENVMESFMFFDSLFF